MHSVSITCGFDLAQSTSIQAMSRHRFSSRMLWEMLSAALLRPRWATSTTPCHRSTICLSSRTHIYQNMPGTDPLVVLSRPHNITLDNLLHNLPSLHGAFSSSHSATLPVQTALVNGTEMLNKILHTKKFQVLKNILTNIQTLLFVWTTSTEILPNV